MKAIDDVIEVIERNAGSDSAQLMATALASACSSAYKFSIITAAISLDASNKELIKKLMHITEQDDFDNADQDKALKWLKERDLI